jgi:hypothetical protein
MLAAVVLCDADGPAALARDTGGGFLFGALPDVARECLDGGVEAFGQVVGFGLTRNSWSAASTAQGREVACTGETSAFRACLSGRHEAATTAADPNVPSRMATGRSVSSPRSSSFVRLPRLAM